VYLNYGAKDRRKEMHRQVIISCDTSVFMLLLMPPPPPLLLLLLLLMLMLMLMQKRPFSFIDVKVVDRVTDGRTNLRNVPRLR